MSPTTPPSGSSAAPSPNTPSVPSGVRLGPSNDGNRIVRKRNRIPLSCGPCRQRKLKCNRAMPCENCEKRGDRQNCSYAAPNSRRKTGGRGSITQNPEDMQDRINRLEALILNLVQDQNQSAIQTPAGGQSIASPVMAGRAMLNSGVVQELTPSSTTDNTDAMDGGQPGVESETEQVANSLGVLHVHQNRSMYIGNTHWAAVLDDIQEVKNYFIEHKKQYEEQIQKVKESNNGLNPSIGPSFLLNAGPVPNFLDLLNFMPGKEATDKLVDHFFDQYDKVIHILHPPTWRQVYESYWNNPHGSDPGFIGQIFAMMGISLQSYKRANMEPQEYRGRSEALAAHYRQVTIQCLSLVDYNKPSLYVLEALILHSRGEFQRSKETNNGVWILQAMIIRLAMRMGLHRDPGHFGSTISPYLAEMRRRIWALITLSDTLYSQQAGMPCMIRTKDWDTQLPHNLYDEEFNEHTVVLPDARPSTQFTPITYMIGKAQLAHTLSQIVDLNSQLQPVQLEEVMKLDSELQTTYQQLPSILQASDETNMEQPSTLHMRYSIAMLYHKSMCVLHREFLTKAREDEKYRENRRRCLDSAIKLLRYQATFHYEGRPGGHLPGLAWFDASLAASDFLLAGTIVSLDLWYSAQANSVSRSNEDVAIWGRDRAPEMKEALMTSRNIWAEQRNHSMEAYKAAEIIGVMLTKVDSIDGLGGASGASQTAGSGQSYPYPQGVKAEPYVQGHDEEKPEHTAAMTLGMLSTGMGQSSNASQPSPGSYQGQYPTPSTAAQTPNDLAAAAAQAAGFGGSGSTSADPSQAQNTAQYADLFQSNIPPSNIDWTMWDSMLAPNNLDPVTSSPDLGASGSWQGMQGIAGMVDTGDISLPQGTQELNTNLFANAPNMFPHGTSM